MEVPVVKNTGVDEANKGYIQFLTSAVLKGANMALQDKDPTTGICLLEATDTRTGELVDALCVFRQNKTGGLDTRPIAIMPRGIDLMDILKPPDGATTTRATGLN